jgi:hypothetical protein
VRLPLLALAVLAVAGRLASEESLGDAAKRERERREKGKGSESRVIQEQDLHAPSPKDSKGTFSGGSPAADPTSAAVDPRPVVPSSTGVIPWGVSATPTPPPAGGNPEVDATQAAARARLRRSYQKVAAYAKALGQAVRDFEDCPTINEQCHRRLVKAQGLAQSVSAEIAEADEAARQGWLPPGDLRAAREEQGLHDAAWEQLLGWVQQYKHGP